MKALAIIQLAQAVLAAANSEAAKAIITDLRNLIGSMFKGGLISAEEQNATRAYVDGVEAAVLAGITPKHWTVEPDPETK